MGIKRMMPATINNIGGRLRNTIEFTMCEKCLLGLLEQTLLQQINSGLADLGLSKILCRVDNKFLIQPVV
jgi:hypothetical protein